LTQLDLSGNLLVGLPLALASLSNLIYLRKGGRRNAIFPNLQKNVCGQKLKKNCSHEIFLLENISHKKVLHYFNL
jgi:Leucine-rich repeat (LRR) protein